MAIPAFDQHGLLPAGTHVCTWAEVEGQFCWNPHRTALYGKLQDFISQEWLPLNIAAPMFVDGSFTRTKEAPKDIDLVADVSHIMDARFLNVMSLFGDRDRITATYELDFWIRHPFMPNDLTAFFCYTGVKAGAELGLDAKHVKGILKVNP